MKENIDIDIDIELNLIDENNESEWHDFITFTGNELSSHEEELIKKQFNYIN